MKDHSPGSGERTLRPCWPAKKGRPDDSPATMPPSPLEPRHSPEPPDDAPAPPPRKEKPSPDVQEKLFGDLQKALDVAKYRLLGEGFPEYFVLGGVDQAEGAGVDAMCGPLHDRMKLPPENMRPAAWRQWAYIAARNATVSLLRRKRMDSLTQLDQMPSASKSSLDKHEQELLLRALPQLSTDDQALIDAVYFKGMSRRQYADGLHVGEATIRRRHDNAMRRLRDEIQRLSHSS